MASSLQSLKYSRGQLSVIDQLKLPHELEYIVIKDSDIAWKLIRDMNVRGAPLIAIVAALGLAVDVELKRSTFVDVECAKNFLLERMEFLRSSRPTAVNLFVATDALKETVIKLVHNAGASPSTVIEGYLIAAEKMLKDDVDSNKAIGDFGARRILEISGRASVRVLTICNTGSLATAGYDHGVVRRLHELGKLEHVYACETRPYNQGARLTAFEIVSDGLPGTLIADSMASYLMAVKGVDAVIVGADRVASNGDTANKIGTYQLAIAAKYHNVPFFVAAPTTTLDLNIACGLQIHVEERPVVELTSIFNQRIAPEGIAAWNPSFDVTPSSLIRGIITEVGVAEPSRSGASIGLDTSTATAATISIDMAGFLRSKGMSIPQKSCLPVDSPEIALPLRLPPGYKKMDAGAIATLLVSLETPRSLLWGQGATQFSASRLNIQEVGDGNLNFLYIVTGPSGSVVVKQALPYVRCVGESWPLTLDRATFECAALLEQAQLARDCVPQVYHFDKTNALIVMQFIPPPHLIMRKHLIAGTRINTAAAHLGTFAARTLFGSSALALDAGTLRTRISQWSTNVAMCAITEKVVFTDPYTVDQYNHWTTPHLDPYAAGLRADEPLKAAVAKLKEKFLGHAQALLHADLHTGSVMVTEGSTFVIDPEFAFYGPMGFDIGAMMANLFLSFFSQDATNGLSYAEWVLQQVKIFHARFEAEFVYIWNAARTAGTSCELYPSHVFEDDVAFASLQRQYLNGVWRDSIGFAGAKMIRRTVGIAHVADLESISDEESRARCEKRCINFARKLILASQMEYPLSPAYASLDGVLELAREAYAQEPSANY